MIRAAALAMALAACAEAGPGDGALDGLAITAVAPAVLVPGTELVVDGTGFVPAEWGDPVIRVGDDVAIPARFVDYGRLVAEVDADAIAALGGDADLSTDRATEVSVEIVSAEDGQTYASAPLATRLSVRRTLTPAPDALELGALIFVNDAIEIRGEGLLLGGREGQTVAVVRGCVARGTGPCVAVGPVDVPLTDAAVDRRTGHVPFAPAIAGIEPGVFAGEVVLENRHAGGAVTRSAALPLGCELALPTVFRIAPDTVRLGQYVSISGGGFVGGEAGASTELHLAGAFTGADGTEAAVDLVLVPEVVDGRTARYVVSEDDALGRAVDLRRAAGVFRGAAAPVVTWRGSRVRGAPAPVALALAPLTQVVYLDFRPSYVEALRRFGLRAVDHEIRSRAVAAVRAAYEGVAVDVRTAPPTDFALYTHVEVSGEDPNGMDLLGYDNSPGKDTDNRRLDDRLGGVNAVTQEDGYPGYGGVFVASLLGFSQHPPVGVPGSAADPLFDAIFDPLRPDRGAAVTAADVRAAPTSSGSSEIGAACPATDRAGAIRCAVWALGSLIGTTIAHEVGHSLGLANPYGEGFHDQGDRPDRLMDAGGYRPFGERAELMGQGPGRFCDGEYDYLRAILPAPRAASVEARPPCD